MTPPLLSVKNLVKHFPIRGSRSYIAAVNDVSLNITRGTVLGLVGESGSGKTTIGRCILRLIEATSGQILFGGQDITDMPAKRFRSMRARIQMVFQEPVLALNPRMRIRDTLEEPLLLQRDLGATERQDRVLEVLHMVGLSEKTLGHYVHQISEGQAQRVGIARAFVTGPDLVVLDEPTSVLDVSIRAQIIDLLVNLQEQTGISYILISHDLTAVRQVASQVVVLYLGKTMEVAETEVIFDKPLHPYSCALLSAVLYPDPKQACEPILLKGEIPSPISTIYPKGCPFASRCPEYDSRAGCDDSQSLKEVGAQRWVACSRRV